MELFQPLMILVAGPYRSGTGDDPEKISANIQAMEEVALQVYRKGHLPVLGEWLAIPLIREAGSTEMGDDIYAELFHPVALRLMERCDAVLRIGGPSYGADQMIQLGQEYGKFIFLHPDDIPEALALTHC